MCMYLWQIIKKLVCPQVVATDVPSGGEARRSGQAQVVVTVSDVNDNAPVITSPGETNTHII